jgi:DNA sulfur modification protein DndD
LIGGNNGSGKTTILNSIKIGIYGPYSLGHKTVSEKYKSSIINLMNNKSLKFNNKINSIEVIYDEIEDYAIHNISIKRQWFPNSPIFENVFIFRDGKELKNEEVEDFFSRLKEYTSVSLLSSMILDGEKIAKIIENDYISQYLKELFYSAFNLNLYAVLNQDIQAYLMKEKQNAALDIDEMNYFDQKNKLKELNIKIKNLKKTLLEREKQYDFFISKKKSIIKKYKSYGGLSEDEFNQFSDELDENESSYKNNYKEIVDYLNINFPFAININLLKSARNQIELELPSKATRILELIEDNLTREISRDDFKKVFSSIQKLNRTPIIHNCSIEEYDLLCNKIIEIELGENNKKYNSTYKNIRKLQLSIFDMKNGLNKSDQEELKRMYLNVISINKEIDIVNQNIDFLKKDIIELEEEIIQETNILSKFEKKLYNQKKINSSFSIANRIIEVNTSFIKYKMLEKTNAIKTLSIEFFNKSMSKKHLLKDLIIDPNDFSVRIVTQQNEKLDTGALSAGEKQIFLGSIIKAIYIISGRRMPIIIDTPLARLDSENRIGFVQEILKDISDQVIILSTDKEIVGEVLKILKGNLARTYLLKSKSKNKSIIESNSYFEEVGS